MYIPTRSFMSIFQFNFVVVVSLSYVQSSIQSITDLLFYHHCPHIHFSSRFSLLFFSPQQSINVCIIIGLVWNSVCVGLYQWFFCWLCCWWCLFLYFCFISAKNNIVLFVLNVILNEVFVHVSPVLYKYV